MDAIIQNAGVYGDTPRHPIPEGHPRLLAVNTLAPYLLNGLIQTPDRLIYLTSDMHVGGEPVSATSGVSRAAFCRNYQTGGPGNIGVCLCPEGGLNPHAR